MLCYFCADVMYVVEAVDDLVASLATLCHPAAAAAAKTGDPAAGEPAAEAGLAHKFKPKPSGQSLAWPKTAAAATAKPAAPGMHVAPEAKRAQTQPAQRRPARPQEDNTTEQGQGSFSGKRLASEVAGRHGLSTTNGASGKRHRVTGHPGAASSPCGHPGAASPPCGHPGAASPPCRSQGQQHTSTAPASAVQCATATASREGACALDLQAGTTGNSAPATEVLVSHGRNRTAEAVFLHKVRHA